jgi:ketosteroid isomerase-like protein
MTIWQELQNLCDDYAAAYRAGDAAGCAAFFTEDAVLHSVFAPPARGRAAITALHEVWTVDGGGKTLTVVQAAGSGNVAWFAADFAEGHETGEGH